MSDRILEFCGDNFVWKSLEWKLCMTNVFEEVV